jgi:Flp pilus assembly CpaF family ATPase
MSTTEPLKVVDTELNNQVVDNLEVVDQTNNPVVDIPKVVDTMITTKEKVVDNRKDNLVVDKNISVVDTEPKKKIVDTMTTTNNPVVDQKEQGAKMSTTEEKIIQSELSEIEKYNEQVYQRAKTRDPKRFFTFPDGRKIVRTKCGCVPLGYNGIVPIYD